MIDRQMKCVGLMGMLFGHKFEARYNTSSPTLQTAKGEPKSLPELLEASKAKKYIHDVCVRCGDIVG